MMSMKRVLPILVTYLLVCAFFLTSTYADNAPLEVTDDGKVNINTVLHMPAQSEPPANPAEGDIYFTTTKKLLIYTNGEWTLIAAAVNHGVDILTEGSGEWQVPVGIYSVTVTLVGGGGGSHWLSGTCGSSVFGDRGGVQNGVHKEVFPGQKFLYSVGASGSSSIRNCYQYGSNCTCSLGEGATYGGTTFFDDISATGGGAGGGGSGTPLGEYPYGNNGQHDQPGAIYIQY